MDLENVYEDDDDVKQQITEEPQQEESDIISDLLKDRGIEDKNKIKFEDDSGNVVERSWDSLTIEEQKNILNQDPNSDPEKNLDEQEIEMINQMRLHGMNPVEYVTALRQQGAAMVNNRNDNQEPNYETDDFTDDELFILDLQYRSPEMSDEEAYQALESAKNNEELFKKQIAGIRQYYKGLETDMKSQKELEAQQEQEEQFQNYSNMVLDSIQNINSIGNLDLDLNNEDKEELAQFILGRDQAGINWFGKALEDPDTVVRMAWFALKGEDAFNDIENYISQQIKTAAQNAYNKGLEEGKKNKVVINPSYNKITTTKNKIIDLKDLDF